MTEPFRVLPWDFFPDPNRASPHREAIQISGAPRVYELLRRGGRVYFRLEGDASRLWATLNDDADTDLVRAFRRAIGSGRVGRVWSHERPLRYWEKTRWFVMVASNGRAQMREWFCPHWVEIGQVSPQLRAFNHKQGVFGAQRKPPMRDLLRQSQELLFDAPFSAQDRAWTEWRWTKGNATELARLLPTLFLFYADQSSNVWKKFGTAPPQATPSWELGEARCQWGFHDPTGQLRAIFDAHFQGVGLQWFEVSTSQLETRSPTRRYWNWEEGHTTTLMPKLETAHQHLEAQLTLRDWLASKVSPAQLEAIWRHVVG